MSGVIIGTAATVLMDVAKDVYSASKDAVKSSVSQLPTTPDEAYRRFNTANSLTQLAKRTTIRSRVYVDSDISRDPITANVIKVAENLYVSMILQALHLQEMVTQGRTVSDSLSVIQTSGMEDYVDTLGGLESLFDHLDKHRDVAAPDPNTTISVRHTKDKPDPQSIALKDVTPAPADLLPRGRLVDITLSNPNDPKISQTVTLLVQMMPYIVPTLAMKLMMSTTSRASFGQRYLQWKAGEISFWHDLVFQLDHLRQVEKAAAQDKSGTFYEYLKEVSQRQNFSWKNKTLSSSPSSNVANAVMILTEETARRAKVDVGLDFTNHGSRERFFANSYAMMVFVIDPSYNSVTMYLNGIDDVGHYTYDNFSSSKGGGQSVDLVQLLAAMTQGKAPRF